MSETHLDREQYVLGDPSAHVGFLNCERLVERAHIHGWSVEAHYHEGLAQLFIFGEGKITSRIDYAPRDIEGPAMVWLPALCSHAFEYQKDMDGWVITVPTSDLARITSDIPWLDRWIGQPQMITGAQHTERLVDAINLVQQIETEHRIIGEDRNLALKSMFTLMLISLYRGLRDGTEQENTISTQSQKLVNRYRSLLDQHILSTRSVSDYAAMLSVTPTHLSRTMKAVSGQTAGEIIGDRVMLEAKRNLTFTDLPIAEIAYLLLFSSASYFTRFFLKHTNETPRRFRKRMRDSFRIPKD